MSTASFSVMYVRKIKSSAPNPLPEAMQQMDVNA